MIQVGVRSHGNNETMPNLRHFRVRELLKREIGEILRRDLPVESSGMVTVTDVVMAPDLKMATVYLSVLGAEDQKKVTHSQLMKMRSHVRGELGRSVTLKYTPKLRFMIDDHSAAKGDRVLEILDEIEKALPEE